MNRHRISPITIKKQTMPNSKRQNEIQIEQLIQSLEQKTSKIRFSKFFVNSGENQERGLDQLWQTLQSLKSAEAGFKYLNDSVNQVGEYLNSNSPDKGLRSPKNSEIWQFNSVNRTALNLLNQSQSLRQQLQALSKKISHKRAQQQMQKIRTTLQFKQDLSQKLKQFEIWLHQTISTTKQYTMNSKLLADDALRNNLKNIQSFKRFNNKKLYYQQIVGMITCHRKWMDDKQLRKVIKEKWAKNMEKESKISRTDMKGSLIQAQKQQNLKIISESLHLNDKQISQSFSKLRQLIKNTDIKQSQFHLSFAQVEQLSQRIEGTILHFENQLQKIQETVSLSKPKTYFIQHRDPEIVNTSKHLLQLKQKWQQINRLLQFQFCF